MSIRVDTVSLIPGAIVCGNRGLGVVGSLIPASGDHGPGYTYNDLSLPADNGKEICGRITTWPTSGTLTAYEDTSFEYTGTSDTFQYQLYVDGVSVGSPTTVTLQVGAATAQIATLYDAAVFSGSASVASTAAEATISAVFDDAVFSGSASLVANSNCNISSNYDDVVFSGNAYVSARMIFDSITSDCVFYGLANGQAVTSIRPIEQTYSMIEIDSSYNVINIDPSYWTD